MSGRDRIPMTSGTGIAWGNELAHLKELPSGKIQICETCAENNYLIITHVCAECVKFSNWKDVEG